MAGTVAAVGAGAAGLYTIMKGLQSDTAELQQDIQTFHTTFQIGTESCTLTVEWHHKDKKSLLEYLDDSGMKQFKSVLRSNSEKTLTCHYLSIGNEESWTWDEFPEYCLMSDGTTRMCDYNKSEVVFSSESGIPWREYKYTAEQGEYRTPVIQQKSG